MINNQILREGYSIRVNKPEWYKNSEFLTWLNDPSNRLFTTHIKGQPPSDFSDIILYYEDDTDSFGNLPWVIEQELLNIVQDYNSCLVWISNLKENYD